MINLMQELYGSNACPEVITTDDLYRAMELGKQHEQIRQMKIFEEYHGRLLDAVVNLCQKKHTEAAGKHNYWLVAANTIKTEFINPVSTNSTSRSVQCHLIRENADGSATYQFDFNDVELTSLLQLGIITALKAGIEEGSNYNPLP